MKIGLDARWIFPRISGIGAYTRELMRALPALDDRHEYVFYFSSPALLRRTMEEVGLVRHPRARAVCVAGGAFSPWAQIAMPWRLRRDGVQVFHSTNYMIPLPAFPRLRCGRAACVVTIHDLIPLLFPDHAPRSLKSRFFPVYRWLMREIAARADRIITVSETSRHDVLRLLRLPSSRAADVRAVYSGVAAAFRPAPDSAARRNGPRTVLYVGRADPYKNQTVLVEAFAKVRRRASFPVRLRLVGPADPRYPETARRIKALGLAADVVQSGYLHDEALVAAYQDADVFVLPSRYEGFGLPVLEAMACGTPVVCTDAPAFDESAGEAAWRVPVGDVESLAEAIWRLLTDESAARRLRERGLQHVKRFSWTRAARETLQVYEHAARRTETMS